MRNQGIVVVGDQLYSLAYEPDVRGFSYSGCNVNGVRYLAEERDSRLATQNSGIVVPSEHDDEEIDFYGF